MSNYINVIAIVEGKTEQIFIEKILAPYIGHKNIGIRATQVSKPGQKGGDVRFSRVQRDLEKHLKQRSDTYITTFVDYYGMKEWPGMDLVPWQASPETIAKTINEATKSCVVSLFAEHRAERRFIPFIAVHEFEALFFSDCRILAEQLRIDESVILLDIFGLGSPEAINNNPQTAPSKRLDSWCKNEKFLKITTGISVAEQIGIEKMRSKCQLFDRWLKTFEEIQSDAR